MSGLLAATSLGQQVDDAALLATLILVLVPLFTSARASRVAELAISGKAKKEDATGEMLLNGTLAAITFVVFLAGLPLWIDVAGNLHPLDSDGVSQSLFAIVWLLLLGLLAWQISLVCKARSLTKKLPART